MGKKIIKQRLSENIFNKKQEKNASQVHHELEIEKMAINAEKARSMAKEVGLLPIGNWKGALRTMRNMRTGDLLNGKELSKAKAKIGLLSNNAYQKLKSTQRKLPSNTEIGGIVDRATGKLKASEIGAIGDGQVGAMVKGKLSNLHTHPYTKGEMRFGLLGGIGKELQANQNTSSKAMTDSF